MQKKIIFWDPSPEIFSFPIPFLDRPILWYGFFFALGFFVAYWFFSFLLKKTLLPYQIDRKEIANLTEKVAFYILVGAIVGARVGDLLFYQNWAQNLKHPLSMIKFWEGGLASHGGAIGIAIALCIFFRKMAGKFPMLSWRALLDLIVIPTCFAASMIRIGNFMNQEIIGTPTNVPWAVVFGHPADHSLPVPRHPVQIYESLFYFMLFVVLWFARRKIKEPGRISGLFFAALFSFRFFIEFFKSKQSELLSAHALLDMGQILSIPFIFFGIYLLVEKKKNSRMAGWSG
ncbi:MAG TPA: prolipoprotein diacylglyceryl transferase [Rhabdochlamydiaceae bacterium]|nr:prolipoprotein diacylglyceryl transferase [Rhabdochlamydiaceae bacterium]